MLGRRVLGSMTSRLLGLGLWVSTRVLVMKLRPVLLIVVVVLGVSYLSFEEGRFLLKQKLCISEFDYVEFECVQFESV
jgi:hypothetical protein